MGVSPGELLVVFLVIIIWIKPEEIPAFFRSIGKLYGKCLKAYSQFEKQVKVFSAEIEDVVADEKPKTRE